MGIGKQQASSHTLDRFLAWADAYGFRIAEHPKHGGVGSGHTRGSWHFDGLAADLNWGPPGTSRAERKRFLYAIDVAQSMGLGVIHAVRGTTGSAASHQTHLHVDCGPSTNLGDRYTITPRGDRKVQSSQWRLNFPMKRRDNLWGPDTDKRWEAVRRASRHHGTKFPHGIRLAQRAVGTKRDGIWGPDSRGSHDDTVHDLQGILGAEQDGIWGPQTDRLYLALRKEKKR